MGFSLRKLEPAKSVVYVGFPFKPIQKGLLSLPKTDPRLLRLRDVLSGAEAGHSRVSGGDPWRLGLMARFVAGIC